MSREVLEKLSKGEISVDEAEKLLKVTAIAKVGEIARLDINRELRKGFPEIVLAEGKKTEDLLKIILKMLQEAERVVVSRVSIEQTEAIRKIVPKGSEILLNESAKMIILSKEGSKIKRTGGKIGLMTAGTSDIPVAEEAKVVAEEMGCEVITAYDIGIAGIHRLFQPLSEMIMKDVDVFVVAAGRECALPSVVAGLVDVPVIGVPTSMGYGFGEKGLSALMALLQACPLGIVAVNIDGGVPAGAVAALIANRIAKFKKKDKDGN